MSVPIVTDSTARAATTATAAATGASPTDQLGKQEFLQLLIAQLRNQDPLRPMEDTEFIAQLAQLNTLEQMQQMNATLGVMVEMSLLTQAASLIGKQITAKDPVTGEVTTGVVHDISVNQGEPVLNVGGAAVPLSHVVTIGTAPATPPAGTA
ncbi:MAG: flagellar hook capping FlgD N-terminal domain-containing protein [Sphaerobacter sp.]|nr:flagellar hook capping FlgD N-terminal domain-containing protein [Sphaerobacter sp.]